MIRTLSAGRDTRRVVKKRAISNRDMKARSIFYANVTVARGKKGVLDAVKKQMRGKRDEKIEGFRWGGGMDFVLQKHHELRHAFEKRSCIRIAMGKTTREVGGEGSKVSIAVKYRPLIRINKARIAEGTHTSKFLNEKKLSLSSRTGLRWKKLEDEGAPTLKGREVTTAIFVSE